MNSFSLMKQACAVLLSGLAVLAVSAATAEPVGNTLFVYGTVTVERPQNLDLSKGDSLFAGDTIVTGTRSRAQLLMKDGAKVALRPDTRFTIDEYVEAGDETTAPDGSVVVAEESSAVSTLIKGGFRTITGAIGDKNPEAFEARTPVATLGIRGTDFIAVYCNAATSPCSTAPGIPEGEMPEDGLYVGASSGQVVLNNDAGSLAISPGQYAYVSQPSEPPKRLPGPPPIIYANSAVGGGEAEEAEGESESAATAEEAGAAEESAEGSEESAESSEEGAAAEDSAQTESESTAESSASAESTTDTAAVGGATTESTSTGGGTTDSGAVAGTTTTESSTAGGGTTTASMPSGGGAESPGVGGATASTESAGTSGGGDSFPAVPVAENPWSDATALAGSDSDDGSAPASDSGSDAGSDAGTATSASAPTATSTSSAARRRPASTGSDSSTSAAMGGAGAAGADTGSGDSFGTPTEPVIEIIATDENGTPVDLIEGTPEVVGDPPVFKDVAFATGPLLQSQAFTSTSSNLKADVITGQAGASVRGFKNRSPGAPTPRGSTYAIGTASNFNVGFDPVSQMRWGRWSARNATVVPPSAASSTIALANKSLHWVVGPDYTSPPVLPITGSATFDVIAGNTDPTDNLGNVGVLGSANLLANFTNQTVTANVLVSIAGSVWSGNGSSALTGHKFGAAFSSVLINGAQGAGGNFSGFFTAGTQGAVNGAGLSYALQSFDGTVVGGVVVFGPARP